MKFLSTARPDLRITHNGLMHMSHVHVHVHVCLERPCTLSPHVMHLQTMLLPFLYYSSSTPRHERARMLSSASLATIESVCITPARGVLSARSSHARDFRRCCTALQRSTFSVACTCVILCVHTVTESREFFCSRAETRDNRPRDRGEVCKQSTLLYGFTTQGRGVL